jgi:hypothetical protein
VASSAEGRRRVNYVERGSVGLLAHLILFFTSANARICPLLMRTKRGRERGVEESGDCESCLRVGVKSFLTDPVIFASSRASCRGEPRTNLALRSSPLSLSLTSLAPLATAAGTREPVDTDQSNSLGNLDPRTTPSSPPLPLPLSFLVPMLPSLPNELIDGIIRLNLPSTITHAHYKTRQSSLLPLALVSKRLHHVVKPILEEAAQASARRTRSTWSRVVAKLTKDPGSFAFLSLEESRKSGTWAVLDLALMKCGNLRRLHLGELVELDLGSLEGLPRASILSQHSR